MAAITLSETIKKFAEQQLQDHSLFIVGVHVSKSRQPKVQVLVDGDEGVSIDTCAQISRKLGETLEQEEVFKGPYTLEVSSPGVDHPLQSERQYVKNIGRRVKVVNEDGNTVKGELKAVENGLIEVLAEKKEKKKVKKEVTKIPLQEIKKTTVLISFK